MFDYLIFSKIVKDKIKAEELSKELKKRGIELSVASIKKYKNGTVKNPPYEIITTIADICEVSFLDFFTDGQIQKEKIEQNISYDKNNHNSLSPKIVLPENVKKISLLYGYVGAGSGGLVEDIVLDEIYIDINLILSKYKNNDIFGIQIIGDSMTPYVNAKDIILYSPVEDNFVRSDGKYIINKNGDLMLKNIKFCLNGDIVISSENKAYESETISKESQELDNFSVIGRVAGRILKG